MPNQKKPETQGKLNEDKLVRSLVPDPSKVPDARVLVGFVGKSARERHWRLYLNPNLNEYVEFADSDVLHSQPLEGSDHPLGGTVVWFKREANLVRTRAVSREAQADFLQGDIAAAHLAAVPRRPRIGSFKRRTPQPAGVGYSMWLSCVPEFCEFVPASPEWWCTPLCTWEAECP